MYQGNENDSSDMSTNHEEKLDYDSSCLKNRDPKIHICGVDIREIVVAQRKPLEKIFHKR